MIHTAEKVFECNLCYKKFLKRSYLHNHQRTVPASDQIYVDKVIAESDLKFRCSTCSLRFISSNVLNYHRRSHEKQIVHQCQVCSLSFQSIKLLKMHCSESHGKRTLVDGSNKRYKCKLCYLKCHQQVHKFDQEAFQITVHDDDLQHLCEKCDKRFISKHALEFHVNKIHREKFIDSSNKECKLCYKKFTKLTYMLTHRNKMHQQYLEYLSLIHI